MAGEILHAWISLAARSYRVGPEFVVVRIGIWPLTFPNFPFITGFKEFPRRNRSESGLGGQLTVRTTSWHCIVGGDRTLGATFVSRTPSDATLQTCCALNRSRRPLVPGRWLAQVKARKKKPNQLLPAQSILHQCLDPKVVSWFGVSEAEGQSTLWKEQIVIA